MFAVDSVVPTGHLDRDGLVVRWMPTTTYWQFFRAFTGRPYSELYGVTWPLEQVIAFEASPRFAALRAEQDALALEQCRNAYTPRLHRKRDRWAELRAEVDAGRLGMADAVRAYNQIYWRGR